MMKELGTHALGGQSIMASIVGTWLESMGLNTWANLSYLVSIIVGIIYAVFLIDKMIRARKK